MLQVFGKDWLTAQQREAKYRSVIKPLHPMHALWNQIDKLHNKESISQADVNEFVKIEDIGKFIPYISMFFNNYSFLENVLPRLRKKVEFESALCEVTIAASFAANASLDIEFLKPTGTETPDLRISNSSSSIYVECKRKIRPLDFVRIQTIKPDATRGFKDVFENYDHKNIYHVDIIMMSKFDFDDYYLALTAAERYVSNNQGGSYIDLESKCGIVVAKNPEYVDNYLFDFVLFNNNRNVRLRLVVRHRQFAS